MASASAAVRDNELSDDGDEMRRMLRDSAADFVARSDLAKNVRAWRGKTPGFDRARWSEMAGLGWTGIRVPEEFGGAGLAVADAVALLMETARGLGPEPLSAVAILAARAIVEGGEPAACTALLPGLCDGSRILVAAFADAAGQMSASEVSAQARDAAGAVTLTGTKLYISGAAGADGFIVAAREADGVGLFHVAREAQGVTLDLRPWTDGTFCGTLRLDRVMVAAADRVASASRGERALDAALEEARVAASAEMLGLMSEAQARTLDYLRTRKQFGKAIGSFQALQHRSVDLFVEIELTRAALDRAVRTLDATDDPRERALAASACKARASDAALHVAREAIQMHGAIGYTDEHDIGLFVRRALVLSAWLGNAGAHRRRYERLAPPPDLA
jgi:alkylation response protein AidB-like acyl-CoA dehydrogenase